MSMQKTALLARIAFGITASSAFGHDTGGVCSVGPDGGPVVSHPAPKTEKDS